MPSITKALQSQIGRKILTGITGVALMLFIIVHLSGNLSLFGGEGAFNKYTHTLESMGALLYLAEIGLIVLFALHAWIGISIYLRKRKARPEGYETYKSIGGPSKQSSSSKTMIWSGIILLVFVVLHVIHFKFGPGVQEGYTMTLESGETVRDLKRLVIEEFQKPWITFIYVAVMVFLGFHLRHGFWSAFTSLTMRHNNFSNVIYTIGVLFAIVMAVGFIFIPLYIFFTGGQGALIAY